MWDLWWTKWHWDRFFPEFFGFPSQFHSTVAPLLGKIKKTQIHNSSTRNNILHDFTLIKLTVTHFVGTEVS